MSKHKRKTRLKTVVIGVLISLLQPQVVVPPPVSVNIDLSKQIIIKQGDNSTVNLTL